MSEKIYDVSADWAKRAFIDSAKYREMYARSVNDPNGFWSEQAKRIGWIKHFTKVENASFAPGKISIKWFEDGVLNVAGIASTGISTSAATRPPSSGRGDNPSESKAYHLSAAARTKSANSPHPAHAANVKKGDRVTIYLPMIPEAAYAMLACARIGAIHSVVFAGFSPDSLAQRITDCQSKVVITATKDFAAARRCR